MSSAPRTKTRSARFPLIILLILVIGGYAAYLVQYDQALSYQADALAPSPFMYKPLILTRMISAGGYLGTLIAVLMNVVHALLYTALAFSIACLVLVRFFRPRNQEGVGDVTGEKAAPPKGRYTCEIPGSSLMVLIPDSKDPASGEAIPGVNDSEPFEQIFLRCDREAITTARAPETPLEKLQVAVLELLKAHRTVPASIGHHHADATLADHSIAISKTLVEYMQMKGWPEPLARVAGLAHDLDKLLAYQEKSPGVWVKRKNATHHNTYSAYLVQQQPEFLALDEEDRFTLTMALRYYHHPKLLPKNAGDRVENLITALRHADGQTIQNEKAAGIEQARAGSKTHTTLRMAIEKFLSSADINSHKGGHNAAGWTKEGLEYVVIPMSGLVERLGEFVPNELARQLQLNVDSRNFHHPATPLLLDALTDLGLLLTKVKDMETVTGRFDVKVGIKDWKACVLLDKDQISEILPLTVPKWGNTAHGGIRVKGPAVDKNEPEKEDLPSPPIA